MRLGNQLVAAVVILFCSTGLFVSGAQDSPQIDQQAIMKQAREAYYNLRKSGLVEFQANVQPNWELILKDKIAADPVNARAGLKLLNGIRFSVIFDSQGNTKVNHSGEVVPPNETVADGLKQVYLGMDQTLSGFFVIWKLFMFDSPLPKATETYQLQDIGGQYRLSFSDGESKVVTMLNKDRVITDITVFTAEFKSVIKPHFAQTPKGQVLVSFEANYVPTTGRGVVSLNIQLDYQYVKGLQLPHKLQIDATSDGVGNQMELLLNDYQVKTR